MANNLGTSVDADTASSRFNFKEYLNSFMQGGIQPNLIAGLAIAGLLIPEAIAYAGIANLSPQAGITALFIGLLVYAFLGNSKYAIVSATSSSAAVITSALTAWVGTHNDHYSELAMALVLTSGVAFIVARLAKLGDAAHFIAKPVLRGASLGIALTITLKQLPAIVEYKPTYHDFFRFGYQLFTHVQQWNYYALTLGIATFILLKLLSHWRFLPAMLIVLAVGIALTLAGVCSSYGIDTVGAFTLTWPTPDWPSLGRTEWLRVGELTVALIMLIYAESFSTIQTFGVKHNDSLNPNQDLTALGVANVICSLFQANPVGAGFSATSANESLGATSKLAGLFAALFSLLLLIIAGQYIQYIPDPVLASIVIFAVSHNISVEPLLPYFNWQRDRGVVTAAFLGVLVLGIMDGLLAGMAVSLLMLLKKLGQSKISWLGQLNNGHSYVNRKWQPEAIKIKETLIARPDEPIFFANAGQIYEKMFDRVKEKKKTHYFILSLEQSNTLDATSLEGLDLFAAHLEEIGVELYLARVKLPLQVLLAQVKLPHLKLQNINFPSVADAVAATQKNMTPKMMQATASPPASNDQNKL